MSKYGSKKVTVDCITFDSKIEAKYYEKLLADKANGLIENFILQPKYVLQPKFLSYGKMYRAIEYVADFEIYYADGTVEVIDIKGMATPEAKLKRKLYSYQPGSELKWIVWYQSKWMDYDEVQKIKRDRKKAKEVKP